jgi:8-oxo-dGTP diphosphatase
MVRHAKAGSRSGWQEDDRQRPLTAAGWDQARALAARLRPLTEGTLVSSPYLRCVQTLAPLAWLLAAEVTTDERLAEGNDARDVLGLLAELADGSVLCSHGDVIPETLDALVRRGCLVAGEPQWGKGSVWVLHREGSGAITRAAAWPPPPASASSQPE